MQSTLGKPIFFRRAMRGLASSFGIEGRQNLTIQDDRWTNANLDLLHRKKQSLDDRFHSSRQTVYFRYYGYFSWGDDLAKT